MLNLLLKLKTSGCFAVPTGPTVEVGKQAVRLLGCWRVPPSPAF